MVVRFEVDACIPPPKVATKPKKAPAADPDDLVAALGGLSIETTTATAAADPRLTILRGGYEVAQSALIELTTRTERRASEFDWVDPYPQLFLSQTPNHYLGVHDRGEFRSLRKNKLGAPAFAQVENSAQASLRKLCALLKTIKAEVVGAGERGRLSVVCVSGTLMVYQRTSEEGCLPRDVMVELW